MNILIKIVFACIIIKAKWKNNIIGGSSYKVYPKVMNTKKMLDSIRAKTKNGFDSLLINISLIIITLFNREYPKSVQLDCFTEFELNI
jgi:hypothetical protein